jgi:predicted GNAT superfamily acetyltransferase
VRRGGKDGHVSTMTQGEEGVNLFRRSVAPDDESAALAVRGGLACSFLWPIPGRRRQLCHNPAVTPSDDALELRELHGAGDYAACVALQHRTWGAQFQEAVPASVLKISQRVGSVAAGAFDHDGRMLGFVFGLTGVRMTGQHRQIAHWSHMLAVAPEARDQGLGTRLKLFQRDLLLPLGVEVVEWTYDPLEARNAHLNLNRLGGTAIEYVEEMYQEEVGSDLWRGIGTDRLIVSWPIKSERVERALAGERRDIEVAYAGAPHIGLEVLDGNGADWQHASRCGVEIPTDIQGLKGRDPELAQRWRKSSRAVLSPALATGWRVEGFFRESVTGRCFYGLIAPS